MKTYSARPADVKGSWHVIDAEGQTLGRLATQVAVLLRGKHKAVYTPHFDTGDYVIIVNAAKVTVTGRKLEKKLYYRHSGYPGGFRSISLGELMATKPTRVVEHAIQGMLPKGPLGRSLFRKLKVYAGPDHPHESQVVGQEHALEAALKAAAPAPAPTDTAPKATEPGSSEEA